MNRLSTQEELILHTLQNKELSGLQIIQQILADSGGERNMKFWVFYPIMYFLEKKGLVESRYGDARPKEREGARRRYYKLTAQGNKIISEIQSIEQTLGCNERV